MTVTRDTDISKRRNVTNKRRYQEKGKGCLQKQEETSIKMEGTLITRKRKEGNISSNRRWHQQEGNENL